MFNPKLFLPSYRLLLAAALLLALPGCGNSPSKTQAAGKGQSGRGSQGIPVAVAKPTGVTFPYISPDWAPWKPSIPL